MTKQQKIEAARLKLTEALKTALATYANEVGLSEDASWSVDPWSEENDEDATEPYAQVRVSLSDGRGTYLERCVALG